MSSLITDDIRAIRGIKFASNLDEFVIRNEYSDFVGVIFMKLSEMFRSVFQSSGEYYVSVTLMTGLLLLFSGCSGDSTGATDDGSQNTSSDAVTGDATEPERDSVSDVRETRDETSDKQEESGGAEFDIKWVDLMGSGGEEVVNALTVDQKGQAFAVGSSNGEFEGKPYGGGAFDVLTTRHKPDGTRSFTHLFGTRGAEAGMGVAVSDAGGTYLGGVTNHGFEGKPFRGGKTDGFVRKFASNGAPIWVQLIGSEGNDDLNGVARGPEGGVIVAVSSTAALEETEYKGGKRDAFVLSLDDEGNRQWILSLGSTSGDRIFDMTTTSNAIYVVGRTGGELKGRSFNGGRADGFIARMSKTGELEWTRLLGGEKLDRADGVAVGPSGDIYVVGVTQTTLGDDKAYAGGMTDGYLARYSPEGKQESVRLVGTTGRDDLLDIAVNEDGEIYTIGSTNSTFDENASDPELHDVYFEKYQSVDSRLKRTQIRSSGFDTGTDIAVSEDGPVFISGKATGNFGGQEFSGGESDAFVGRIE